MELKDHVVAITGATSGIGEAMANAFALAAARVAIAGRRAERGRSIAGRLGRDAVFVPTDVTVEADVQRLVSTVIERWGRLDCLVNNAGTGGVTGSLRDADRTRFDASLATHIDGTLLGMKHAARVMTAQGSGCIINVSSIASRLAGWTAIDYAAAKAAVVQMTRCAAVELARDGIRVNCLSPGPVLTGIFAKAGGIDAERADDGALDLEAVFADRLAQWQPLPRPAVPQDIAPVAVWLASDAARFVTGQDITVDGGITAGRPIEVAAADRTAMANVIADQRRAS